MVDTVLHGIELHQDFIGHIGGNLRIPVQHTHRNSPILGSFDDNVAFQILVHFGLTVRHPFSQSIMIIQIELVNQHILDFTGVQDLYHLLSLLILGIRLHVQTLVIGFLIEQNLGHGIGTGSIDNSC